MEKQESDGEKQIRKGNLCKGRREKKEDLIFRVGSCRVGTTNWEV